MLARIFSCTRRIAASDLVPTRKRAVTITWSSCGLRIDVLDAVDALDDGLERLGDELDRVLGLSPSARTWMSTIGTEICGSSSRGSETSATRPKTKAASRNSGVSGEVMKARVSRPASPRRGGVTG